MRSLGKYTFWLSVSCLAALVTVACGSVEEKPSSPPQVPVAKLAPAPAAAKVETTQARNAKTVEVEGVISAVGQRTITFQMERKGKVRVEVVGVDEKTKIEKGGSNVKLRDLQETDKALINYQPGAYTPALAIKVTGKSKIQKAGGGD